MAARWVVPSAGSLVERAFRLYLDFDGNGQRVGGESTRATSANVDALGAYALHQPGARVMILLFNKATSTTTATLNFGTRLTGPWKLYQFSATSDLSLVGSGAIDSTSISVSNLPARSASLLVLPDADRIFANGFDQP